MLHEENVRRCRCYNRLAEHSRDDGRVLPVLEDGVLRVVLCCKGKVARASRFRQAIFIRATNGSCRVMSAISIHFTSQTKSCDAKKMQKGGAKPLNVSEQ